MKQISKYEACDGTEFDTEKECIAYEELMASVDSIMSKLPAKPNDDGSRFSNGEGYIQHDKTILRQVKIQLLELMKKIVDHKWIQDTIEDENVHPSYVGRLIGEYGGPLNSAWYRFQCIDKQYREWGQPFFASNPEKASKHTRIN